MPEIGLGLDPRTRAAPAEVRRVGGGWDASRGLADAKDRTYHEPLPQPVQEIIDRGEPSPPPSEEELRAKLVEVLAAEKEAQATFDKASATHQRAREHLGKCKAQLAGFDDLQATINAHTAEATRQEGRN
jgi:hypothetical protein